MADVDFAVVEKDYEVINEIGRGLFAIVKRCRSRSDQSEVAVKAILYGDKETGMMGKFVREERHMTELSHPALLKLLAKYQDEKYIYFVMPLVRGNTILHHMWKHHSLTEDIVANYTRQLLEAVNYLHDKSIVHSLILPSHVMVDYGRKIKLLSLGTARKLEDTKVGFVQDVIVDTEFCAPEQLNFDPVLLTTDIWRIGVLVYTMLSGISPFYYEDENNVLTSIQKVQWKFDEEMETVTSQAKDFIKKCLVRAPEMRMSADDCLKHKWLSDDYQAARKNSTLKIQDTLKETDERLATEEEEDYVCSHDEESEEEDD